MAEEKKTVKKAPKAETVEEKKAPKAKAPAKKAAKAEVVEEPKEAKKEAKKAELPEGCVSIDDFFRCKLRVAKVSADPEAVFKPTVIGNDYKRLCAVFCGVTGE